MQGAASDLAAAIRAAGVHVKQALIVHFGVMCEMQIEEEGERQPPPPSLPTASVSAHST